MHAFGPLWHILTVLTGTAELLSDPGSLLEPAFHSTLSLASVADPATLPTAKVGPLGVQVCDSAGAAGAAKPPALCREAARALDEHNDVRDRPHVVQRAPGAVLQHGLMGLEQWRFIATALAVLLVLAQYWDRLVGPGAGRRGLGASSGCIVLLYPSYFSVDRSTVFIPLNVKRSRAFSTCAASRSARALFSAHSVRTCARFRSRRLSRCCRSASRSASFLVRSGARIPAISSTSLFLEMRRAGRSLGPRISPDGRAAPASCSRLGNGC